MEYSIEQCMEYSIECSMEHSMGYSMEYSMGYSRVYSIEYAMECFRGYLTFAYCHDRLLLSAHRPDGRRA